MGKWHLNSFTKRLGVPSLFDWSVILFILILPCIHRFPALKGYNIDYTRGLCLVFGSIAIVTVGLANAQIRAFKSLPLSLLTIWALVNVFLNSWRPDMGVADAYLNWSYLNEGFIYVFMGVLLIRTIVIYAKSYKLYYIPIVILVLCGLFKAGNASMLNLDLSTIGALSLGLCIIMIKRSHWRWIFILLLIILGIVLFPALMYKFPTRMAVWSVQLHDVMNTRTIGAGFDHTVSSIMGLYYIPSLNSIGYRQNDFLEYARYHGIIGMGLVIWFLKDLFWKQRVSVAYFLGLSALILCMVQRTIFHPLQGGIIVIIIALMLLENATANKLLSQTKEGG